jgi:glutamine synthetase adenylyltransferase
MTTQTLDGRVYEIDTRLRPSGEAGLLVTSLKAFEQYQQKCMAYGSIRHWCAHVLLQVKWI